MTSYIYIYIIHRYIYVLSEKLESIGSLIQMYEYINTSKYVLNVLNVCIMKNKSAKYFSSGSRVMQHTHNLHRQQIRVQRPNSRTQWGQKSLEFSSLLFTVASNVLTDITPLPLSKSSLKLDCNGNLKSETSQDFAQKHQRNCKFMNSASVLYRSVRFLKSSFR